LILIKSLVSFNLSLLMLPFCRIFFAILTVRELKIPLYFDSVRELGIIFNWWLLWSIGDTFVF